MNMEDGFSPSYEELASAWWAISEALECDPNPWRAQWHNRVFTELLKQCGWTIEAWNDETEFRKMFPSPDPISPPLEETEDAKK